LFRGSVRNRGREEWNMRIFEYRGQKYEVDDEDFLLHPPDWNENFAEGMAERLGMELPLSDRHWQIIRFIRRIFNKSGKCPMVHETCKTHKLKSADLNRLFPSGYLRGACKLAGLSYRAEQVHPAWAARHNGETVPSPSEDKVYRVNVRGFLVDPAEWDEEFAVYKARELKMTKELTEKHWRIIRFLREQFRQTGFVPTVYETCAANQVEIDELAKLFPDGYHRGAVKIAGLKAV